MGFFFQRRNAAVEERGIYAIGYSWERHFEADVGLGSTETELSISGDKNAKDISNPIMDKIPGSNSKSICLHTQ